jgi:hypothetical protein
MHRGNSAGTSTGIAKLEFQDAVKNPIVIQYDATLLLIIRKSNKMLTRKTKHKDLMGSLKKKIIWTCSD